MTALGKRLFALEQSKTASKRQWHCLRRYEDESDADAITAYEATHGSIGDDNIVMRIIVNKPGKRPSDVG